MVQDKPSCVDVNGVKTIFKGVSKRAINDILKIYDVVYGVDLLSIEYEVSNSHFTKTYKHYKNVCTYITKSQVFGLLDYKHVLFLDATTVVNKNIDYLFSKYKKNHFLLDSSVYRIGMGIHGAVFLVHPSTFYYTKTLYLILHYQKIFGTLYFKRGIDELIIYFTVYPYWSKLIELWTRCTDDYIEKDCPIYHYQIYKPFKIGENKQNKIITFRVWDKYAKKVVKDYPLLAKYFAHIKELRAVNY